MTGRGEPLGVGEERRELAARRDIEFLEDVREVCLDRPSRDVELLGDLRVSVAVRGECGNPMFGRSERGDTRERGATWSSADGAEFVASAVGEHPHAAAFGQVERVT